MNKFTISFLLAACALILPSAEAFVPSAPLNTVQTVVRSATTATDDLTAQKEELLALLSRENVVDPVLADPFTREPLQISVKGTMMGGTKGSSNSPIVLKSASNQFKGTSSTFVNLLEAASDDDDSSEGESEGLVDAARQAAVRRLTPLIPPPLRAALAFTGVDDTYVPMRDLFTSPSVSYAYERGWRQGFAQAGFPGADREFAMAKEYFAPATTSDSSVVVDMSCATGLFTRRFAAEDTYDRVLGCDYSEAMLSEARRRIQNEPKLSTLKNTKLDLVRLDVGQIPMQNDSVDALHAGAAMHCWPDLDAAIQEIYRVLKPGGRYFATTFLSSYFGTLQRADAQAGNVVTSQMAFQYFTSKEEMRKLLERNGFEPEKISVEVVGAACVVIRCEK